MTRGFTSKVRIDGFAYDSPQVTSKPIIDAQWDTEMNCVYFSPHVCHVPSLLINRPLEKLFPCRYFPGRNFRASIFPAAPLFPATLLLQHDANNNSKHVGKLAWQWWLGELLLVYVCVCVCVNCEVRTLT